MLSFNNTCYSIRNEYDLEKIDINRNNCLDHELKSVVANKIENNEEMLFLGNDVSEPIKKHDYCLYIHGIMPCGTKTTVAIYGIEPYADIQIRSNETNKQAELRVRDYVAHTYDDTIDISKLEIITGKDFMFYKHEASKFVREFFKSLGMLTSFIKYCNSKNIKSYSNIISSYYRVVARNYELNLSGWNTIRNYKRIPSNKSQSKAEYVFEIDIHDITGIHSDDEIYKIASSHGYNQSIVRYENMIMASFDIEMIPTKLENFPDAERSPKDEIFMIAITFHFVKQSESILNIVLSLKESEPIEDAFIIHCKTEACLISAFAKCMAMMQPDFITEFNGGGFDWKNVIEKARLLHVLPAFLENMSLVKLQQWEMRTNYTSYFINGKNVKLLTIGRSYNLREIKINGATAPSKVRSLKMVGFVGFDTLVVCKQLEPNADSHKLNECLRRCNLGSKDGLDIHEMFRIYRKGAAEEMKMVSHYCFIDTFKLQQLLIKKNVVQDHREVANLSYTSISDTFLFAGGSRMRNLLMNRAEKLGYLFDINYKPTVEDKTAKFPGAHVVAPKKGIVKPLLRLDEFAAKHPDKIDKSNIKDGYEYIEKNFEHIYHSSEEIDDSPQFIKPYIEYTNKNENQYPISGLDYSSLYPSIIMTYNISPEKLIIDEDYAKKVEKMGKTLQFVTFPFCNKMIKAWFVRHDNVQSEYSICGRLLIELFNRRAALKKNLKRLNERIFDLEQEMKPFITNNEIDKFSKIDEYNEVKFDQVSCDSKQRAVKIFMNTLYGAMGETNSFICAIEVAASVTTMGKYNLMLAIKFVEKEMHMKVSYGDSVIGDTPIIIKRNNIKELVSIEELDNHYESCNDGKECIDYSNENVFVMTEDGYSKILKVIRHRTNKKLYRVTTHIGSVIVTEDHSLLDANKEKIKPQDCTIGTSLLHWESENTCNKNIIDEIMNVPLENIPDDIAFVKGFFFGDGSCGHYICKSCGHKYSFALNNQNQSMLEKCVKIFNEHYTDVKLKIIDTMKSSGVYKATAVGKVRDLVLEWRSEFYSLRKHKKVPSSILNGDKNTKLSFMRGYYAADGDKTFHRMSNKGQIGSQGLYIILLDLGYNVSISTRKDKQLIYRLTFTKSAQRIADATAIKKIEYLGECEDYVYDLETESHHFAAGVGCIVVHNTDSAYVSCNKKYFIDHDREYFTGKIDKISYCTKLVMETFKQIEVAKVNVNKHLIADNGSKHLMMAYEEVLYPVAFLSKKKYYGVPHEEKVDFYPKNLFLRGLEIVKRGSSDVLKDIVNQIIREVMDINSTNDIIDIIKEAIKRFFTTKWSVEVFAKSKVYRADKNNISVNTMMKRYRVINYPKMPEQNVRFKTVICKYYPWQYNINGTSSNKLSIGDRMELVDRVIEENLEIDLDYYFENELTGQLARLISFCDIFNTVADKILPSDVDVESMSEIERQAYDKEIYKKTEDALFNAAKKYINSLSKEYSNSFTNKNSLYVDTWRTVTNMINDRNCQLPFNVKQLIVMSMFQSHDIKKIEFDAYTWSEKYIMLKYKIALTNDQKIKLKKLMSNVSTYIGQQDNGNDIVNGMIIWKTNIIEYIYEEYDYKNICNCNLPYNKLGEVMTLPDELEEILQMENLQPKFTLNQAQWIFDTIVMNIACVIEI